MIKFDLGGNAARALGELKWCPDPSRTDFLETGRQVQYARASQGPLNAHRARSHRTEIMAGNSPPRHPPQAVSTRPNYRSSSASRVVISVGN